MSFNVVIKRCISHYFSNGTDTRVPQNVFLVVRIPEVIATVCDIEMVQLLSFSIDLV